MRTVHAPRPGRPRARVVALITVALAAIAAGDRATPLAAGTCGPDRTQPGGAIYRICMPDPARWNGDLVIWAHGYVQAGRVLEIPEEQLCLSDGFCLPSIANALGYGFATTSYRTNGLVIAGVEDVVELVDLFAAEQGTPARVFLTGASEGGLVTTLAVEQRPDLFDAGLAACGPIGDFRRQVGYYGDFRVLFDVFFPGLMPGTPTEVPPDLVANWDAVWTTTIRPAVFDPANSSALRQLLRTARAPHVPGDVATVEETVHDGLWYGVFASADIVAKLGGQPFDNLARSYTGSDDDAVLNAVVQRYSADPAALAAIDDLLETSGVLARPLVNLHTTLDQQVGFVQELLYGRKLRAAGSMANRLLIPSLRYGHCNFKPWEALLGFAVMVHRASGQVPALAESVLGDAAAIKAYREAAARAGLPPPTAPVPAPVAGAPATGGAGSPAGSGSGPARSLDSP